jgi:hypothetical protein
MGLGGVEVKGELRPETVEVLRVREVLLAGKDAVVADGANGVRPCSDVSREVACVVPPTRVPVHVATGHEAHAAGRAQG